MNRDQAQHLRDLMGGTRGRVGRRAIVRVIASGKGGVGKSMLTLNMGIALAAREQKVLLVDADMNLANLHVLMGIMPEATMKDVALGRKRVQDIIMPGPGGVDLLPAPSGALALMDLEQTTRELLLSRLTALERFYDVILIDTTAGIGVDVIDFVVTADDTVLVTTPEPTAVIDAYALIKVATARRKDIRFHVVVNQTPSEQTAKIAFQKLQIAAEQFLGKSLRPAGYVVTDRRVSQAVHAQTPLMLAYPKSNAARCIEDLAGRILRTTPRLSLPETGRPGFFSRVAQAAKELVEESV